MSPYVFINNIFRADAAKKGGVVRRSKSDVETIASYAELENEVRRRNFHLLEAGGQYVIVCTTAKLTVHF